MCEWLSRGEWCDVQLVCAGRMFNAHRAVLASVSEFLRNVLLTSPQEETPIFILLPDFDTEIMSLVLYYVYNGEVTIDSNKLLLFFEVIKALDIFVDNQYFRLLLNNEDTHYPDRYSKDQNTCLKNILKVKHENGNNLECVNIRKRERSQDIQSGSDPFDNRSSAYTSSDIPLSLENSPTFGDRQRNCFLRDLYIGAYPRNGTVNGVRGVVQAIPNNRYHGPTSVFLMNANGRFPNEADNIFSKVNRNTSDCTPIVNSLQESVQSCFQFHRNLNPINFHNTNSYDLCDGRIVLDTNYISLNGKMSLVTCDKTKSNQILPVEGTHRQLIHTSSLDLRITESFSNSVFSNTCNNSYVYNLLRNNMSDVRQHAHEETIRNSIFRTPFFNQVIESPWRPRLPHSYKPFRRKDENPLCATSHCKKGNEDNIANDNNNNIEDLATARCQYDSARSTSITAKEDFLCAICNQVFMSEDSLSIHRKRHASIPRYSCGDCGKTFSQLRNFKYHMSVHRGTREFAATCTVCGKYFNDRGYLSSHMKIHRNRKEYKCPICPKSFNQRVAYNMHVRIHTGVKPHVCEECGKAFSRKMLLKQHQRTHSGERPYACPHCDKRFADRSNMTLHLRLHTGVKPFSCSLCPKSFTKKHHLKSHLNFHTGAKPYSCPRCHLAFTQSSNMRTHLKKCSAPETSTPTL